MDVLEKEAKDMEFQLKQLQSRMQQQQMEDDAVVKTGGCRWKSARPDKGSVLTYAKDVQDKYRSKYGVGEDPVFRDPPPMRPPSEMTLKSGSMAPSGGGGVNTTEPNKSIPAQSKTSFRQKGNDVCLDTVDLIVEYFSKRNYFFSLVQTWKHGPLLMWVNGCNPSDWIHMLHHLL